jgi:hypothetical protein
VNEQWQGTQSDSQRCGDTNAHSNPLSSSSSQNE